MQIEKKIKLYNDILISVYGIINILIEDAHTKKFIKNQIKSIVYNLFELHNGIRPEQLK